jgi:hypothetical protein
MASLEDSGKGKVPVLSNHTSNTFGSHYRGITGASKLLASGIFDGKGSAFATDPIAGEISVAIHHGNLYAAVQQIGHSLP